MALTDMTEQSARIRRYITENFLYMRPDYQFTDDDALLGKGIIDSLGVMELISFVEEEFGVAVADTDITEQNLGSVNAVARYVASKREGGDASAAADDAATAAA
jgi:acyl carrier protein